MANEKQWDCTWCAHREVCPAYMATQTVCGEYRPMCHDCAHAQPLERNCELNQNAYMHCSILHGEETRNVWHKYKRYYRDYSIVEHDDFCSQGVPRNGGQAPQREDA